MAAQNLTNPLKVDVDAAGHDIGNVDVLNAAMVVVRSDNPVSLTGGSADPRVAPGSPQPIGSLYFRSDQATGLTETYQKTGQADTDWRFRF